MVTFTVLFVGTGELDEKLLSTLFTSVKTYHAVEVKCDLLNMTQDKIDQLPNVKVNNILVIQQSILLP